MATNRDGINQGIAALAYDPKTVMIFNGTRIANIDVPVQDSFDGSAYVVVTREKCTYEGNFDVAVPTAFDDVAYPGALLLAGNELLDGRPQQLTADRALMDITVNLPGFDDLSFRVVPTYSNVQEGINAKLTRWFKAHGDKWNVPANFQYSSSLVYDENELAVKFGCDVNYLKQKIGIDLSSRTQSKKSVYVVHFKQIFYTVSAERPAKPSDVFAETTTWDDLVRAGVSEKHPPLLVKNAQYGRQIYIKFESSLSDTELESTLKAVCSKDGVHVDVNASVEHTRKLSQIDVSIVARGGAAQAYRQLRLSSAEDIDKINGVIWGNTEVSPSNPAAPLNYFTVYLKDGVPGVVSGTTEYIAERTERFEGGQLHLEHRGAYVAKFMVSWDEIGYKDGAKTVTRKSWPGSGNNVTAGYSTDIALLGNVRNIAIKSQGCTGLAWEWWRTSGDRLGLPLVPMRSVRIGGTTLGQSFSMNPP